ncbi:efflux RND transporter periplasmic adaptor subunit [Paraburkholderia silviterrae]|uniref:Efflux RND transporter periplasmic adaptor subunit n=1 Tax=Paraburkholderia silviterrae TaxID=2528715 RepID=A0A4R5LZB8_9BURK|nr:efflux RND transporter periplasmic adaptor subunit [Paraburkholderia silviterrae]
MPPKHRIAAVATALLLGTAIGAYALLGERTAPKDAMAAASEARGADGPLSAEVVVAEKAGEARLIVYPLLDGKPAPDRTAVSATVTRYDGAREVLKFAGKDGKFGSTTGIVAPHVFDAVIDIRVDGRSGSIKYSRADGAVALNASQIKAANIGLATVGPAQIRSSFQLPGEIKFNEDRTAHVVPRVAGVVERVSVSTGQRVEKGELLAVIASTDLADRRSELLTAQRRLSAARTAYQRERTLWEEKISAEQDYQQAQMQLREAEIAAENARQKLAALNAPASASALSLYELRAPFAGTIVEKHLTAGESIAADANVFVISDLSSVWAEMAVPAQRLNDVRVGREAVVSASAFESRATGPVSYVGALLGEQTRTAPARVVLANPDGAWRPGLFVNVSVGAGLQEVPLAIKASAIQEINGAASVFVQSPKGFVAQPIELGRRDEQSVEVLSGLKDGQRYVVANSFVLKAELAKDSVQE